MKIDKSIAKKQMTFVALAVALGLAVYLNYRLSTGETAQTPVQAPVQEEILSANASVAGVGVSDEQADDGVRYYGEAMFVSSDTEAYRDDYFSDARLKRSQARDEALDTLKKSLQNAELTEAEKKALTDSLSATVSAISLETTVESLIKSKGFEDCMAYISESGVKIVVAVGADGLSAAEAAQIKEIVITQCSVSASEITVVEMK